MPPQIAFLRGCIATLVAFVWLFSTVCFQMGPQMACPAGCIVTQIAFVWLFSSVQFQMRLHMTCIRGFIVALIAFVWFHEFVISILHTQVVILRSLFHLQSINFVVLCLMVVLNWGRFKITDCLIRSTKIESERVQKLCKAWVTAAELHGAY